MSLLLCPGRNMDYTVNFCVDNVMNMSSKCLAKLIRNLRKELISIPINLFFCRSPQYRERHASSFYHGNTEK